jgi:ABC-type phosphate transport system ATPase subunit
MTYLSPVSDQIARQYAGKFIALERGEVIFSSPNATEVYRYIKDRGLTGVVVVDLKTSR